MARKRPAANLDPLEFKEHKRLAKCRQLFSKYDEGIRISPTMMYSVTRELIANKIAESVVEMGFDYVVDGCGGAGGNSIAFARNELPVTCVEINKQTIEDAFHNATIYGVDEQIEFVQQDVLTYDPYSNMAESEYRPQKPLLFMSPEWGGPSFRDFAVFDPEELNPPLSRILEYGRKHNFHTTMVYAPRTIDLLAVEEMGCKECWYMYQFGYCNAALLVF